MTDQDELRRVLTQLAAMRENLSKPEHNEHDAARFHEQLDRLDRAGYDVAEFRLDPEKDMFFRVASQRGNEKRYHDTRTVRIGVLESKLDAVLSYFQLAGENRPIGFDVARRN